MSGRKRSKVGEAFVLILQIGLAMMVAVGMMVALAVFLNSRFNTIWFMPPLLILGFAGGVRAAWNLVQGFLKSDGTEERKTYDRIRKLEKERQQKAKAGNSVNPQNGIGAENSENPQNGSSLSEGKHIEVYKRK